MKITKRQLRRIIKETLLENRSPLGSDEDIANALIRKGHYSFKQKSAVINALAKLDTSYKQKLSDVADNISVGF